MREHRRIAAFRYRFLDIGVLFVWCGFARICSFLMMRHCSRKRPNARSEEQNSRVGRCATWRSHNGPGGRGASLVPLVSMTVKAGG